MVIIEAVARDRPIRPKADGGDRQKTAKTGPSCQGSNAPWLPAGGA